jgi:hypothetical protein
MLALLIRPAGKTKILKEKKSRLCQNKEDKRFMENTVKEYSKVNGFHQCFGS